MKILFLGYSGYHTIARLTNAIKNNSDGLSISAATIGKHQRNGNNLQELAMFDEVINLPRKQETVFNGKDKLRETMKMVRSRKKRNLILKNILYFKFGAIKNLINSEAEEHVFSRKMKQMLSHYDVYHFQYIVPETMGFLKYIDRSKKVVISFWGSDLLQTAGKKSYIEQLKALERCDIVTVSTLEMREILLSKFGRQFANKVKLARFLIDESVFGEISDEKKSEMVKEFKLKNKIPGGKIYLSVGYNGTSAQRHIEVLNVIKNLRTDIKERLYLIIPMTYGLEFEGAGYLEQVTEACRSTGIGFTILHEYIKGDDLMALVHLTKIKLNVRDTDALNAAMIESIGTGCIVINGAWLPYGMLRRLGAYYKEVENLEQIAGVLTEVVDNYEKEMEKTAGNPEIIQKHFAQKNLVKNWIEMYHQLSRISN